MIDGYVIHSLSHKNCVAEDERVNLIDLFPFAFWLLTLRVELYIIKGIIKPLYVQKILVYQEVVKRDDITVKYKFKREGMFSSSCVDRGALNCSVEIISLHVLTANYMDKLKHLHTVTMHKF